MTPPPTPDQLMADLQQRLEEARSQLGENPEAVNVTDMAPDIDTMLGLLRALPTAEGKAYLPRLEALMQGFAELETDYRRLMSAISNDMGKLNNTAKAHTAYVRTNALFSSRDEDEGSK